MTTLVLPWTISLISRTSKVNFRTLRKTRLSLHPFRSKSCSLSMASAAQSSTQEKVLRLPPVDQLRTILDASGRGMLSTFSQKYEGYPSGSMVDFACDGDGSPILAISTLAAHSKDLLAKP